MKKRVKVAALAVGILFFCLVFTGTAKAAPAEAQKTGYMIAPHAAAMVPTNQVNVRSGPAVSFPAIGSLQPGQVVNVCGRAVDVSGSKELGWYQVVYGTGIGYVKSSLLTPVPVEEAMLAALQEQAVFVKQQVQAGQVLALQQEQILAAQQAQAAAAQQAQALAAAQAEQNAAPAGQPGSGNIIFVGDSRIGQMSNAIGGPAAFPGTAFLACYGGGVEWLSTAKAKQDIDAFVTPGSVIIINYGVNDLSRHDEYIATINKYNREWREKGAVVFFATVGPVGTNEYGKRNWAVEYFNDQLKNRLDGSIGRLDLYGYLTTAGFTPTYDGIHYQPETYARMFQYLMQSIGRM